VAFGGWCWVCGVCWDWGCTDDEGGDEGVEGDGDGDVRWRFEDVSVAGISRVCCVEGGGDSAVDCAFRFCFFFVSVLSSVVTVVAVDLDGCVCSLLLSPSLPEDEETSGWRVNYEHDEFAS